MASPAANGQGVLYQPDKSKLTQIYGTNGLLTLFPLGNTAYVDFQCLEITRHSGCIRNGNNSDGSIDTRMARCNYSTLPFDTSSDNAFYQDSTVSNGTFKDLYMHGLAVRAIKGPEGWSPDGTGNYIIDDVLGAYNEGTTYDLDDGNNYAVNGIYNSPADNTVPNVLPDGKNTYGSPLFSMTNSTIEWTGCFEQYPIPANHKVWPTQCYGQRNGGQGDGIGSANANNNIDVFMDHDILRYNTQEGEDFGHVFGAEPHNFTFTNSLAYGNAGSQVKDGGGFKNVLYANDLIIGNCNRFTSPIADTPAGYALNMTDVCRSGGDVVSVNFNDTTRMVMRNITVVGSSGGSTILFACAPNNGQADCHDATWEVSNSIFRGYADTYSVSTEGNYGTKGAPAMYCGYGCNGNNTVYTLASWTLKNNMYYGFYACPANGQAGESPTFAAAFSSTGETCVDPLFQNEPNLGTTVQKLESDLDQFNFSLTSNSPAVHSGVTLASPTVDFDGNTFAKSLGALELGSTAYAPFSFGGVLSNLVPIYRSLLIH